MALFAYLRLKGNTQGEIKGSVTRSGREDSIEVLDCKHKLASPRDAASGVATGKRVHDPLTVIKPTDKASPLLYQALVENEQIDELSIEFWRPSVTGKEDQYYTIELLNANLSAMQFNMHGDERDTETLQFAYQKITWTFTDGGITASDDWEAPVV